MLSLRPRESSLRDLGQRQIMNNLAAVRQAAGSDLSSVVKVNIFLTDLADFAAMNEVYEGFFGDPKPVRRVHLSECLTKIDSPCRLVPVWGCNPCLWEPMSR